MAKKLLILTKFSLQNNRVLIFSFCCYYDVLKEIMEEGTRKIKSHTKEKRSSHCSKTFFGKVIRELIYFIRKRTKESTFTNQKVGGEFFCLSSNFKAFFPIISMYY